MPGTQTALFTLGLHRLAILEQASQPKVRQAIDETVQRAQRLIAQRYPEPLDMAQTARELNIGYSYFHRALKKQTGLSPKQHHLKVRLQKAQDLLVNTPKTVKEIAAILGSILLTTDPPNSKNILARRAKEWHRRLDENPKKEVS